MKNHNHYRTTIIKNTTKPSNLISKPLLKANKIFVYSNLCSESYDIFLDWNKNTIIEAKFLGYGCLVSKAALNIICSLIESKTKVEALLIIKNYKAMVYQKKFTRTLIGDLIIFKDIFDHPNRISCALLGVNGIEKYLTGSK